MLDTSSTQNKFVPPVSVLYSHSATFVEPSSSQTYAVRASSGTTSNVGPTAIASLLEIRLTELERGYTVLRPIPVKIRQLDGGFTASFEDANIHASGETWADAARALKSLVIDIYDSLIGETLGPGPKRQLATLSRYAQPD